MNRTTAKAALTTLAVAIALAGCTPSLTAAQDLPLPGGADLGAHPYEIEAHFADTLSLVPQSAVKVNDVAVGRVTAITLAPDDWSAVVTMKINGAVRLPADAYAQLEQSSLLGEKYVQLTPPPAKPGAGQAAAATGDAAGPLVDGSVIPVDRTNRSAEAEEVFGALSMLLNGGGVDQLRTITVELGKALSGNESQVRSLLTQVDTMATQLDAHKRDITDALDGLDHLSATLAARSVRIGGVLTDLAPGLKVLEEQRGALVTMLRSLDTLSGTAVDTVNRSKDDLVADLKALAPVLQRLADAGTSLPDSLQVLLTYPFTDEVLRGVKGDYLNAYLDLTAAPGTRIIPALDADDNAYPPAPDPAPDPTPDPGTDPGTDPTPDPGTDPGTDPGAEARAHRTPPVALPSVTGTRPAGRTR
ncbi:MCE family protein [Kitasatospora sp. NBC_00240]|uniref:MCE family protein n=1 Tax=Kitasatospora sp. NBC_00240 TaxID=2903567 RepID=UPI0022541BCC|nr:MCE family protein [Kitasatospora sp. NBC_00240]MCX5209150.1 MCE family protein [Kitasatospora sp. NBC_00240]